MRRRGAPTGSGSRPPAAGFERIEASFSGHAFDPHRHDTYAIGFTIHGVQSFRYRGAAEHSLPGQAVRASPGRDRMTATPGPTPAFATGSSTSSRGADPATPWRGALPPPLRARGGVERQPASPPRSCRRSRISTCRWRICSATRSSSTSPTRSPQPTRRSRRRTLSARHWRAVGKARDVLDASLRQASCLRGAGSGYRTHPLRPARHFRACLAPAPTATSSCAASTGRARLIRQGAPLVDAALASGFADQSHMTRHFKKRLRPGAGRSRSDRDLARVARSQPRRAVLVTAQPSVSATLCFPCTRAGGRP